MPRMPSDLKLSQPHDVAAIDPINHVRDAPNRQGHRLDLPTGAAIVCLPTESVLVEMGS